MISCDLVTLGLTIAYVVCHCDVINDENYVNNIMTVLSSVKPRFSLVLSLDS